MLQFDDEPSRGNRREQLAQARNADTLSAERKPAVSFEAIAGIDARQLVGGPSRYCTGGVGGAIERGVVNDHGHAVTREVDVTLDAVAALAHPTRERRQCVLRRQLGAAAMREDQTLTGSERV